MSFPIVLQENLSPTNFVTKTITDIATATGTLRQGCSVVDPEIMIESSLEGDILGRVNYAYIAEFNRYYYVTDIVLDVTGLWLMSMHVDVLMSYATEIRQQNAIVARQKKDGNYNLYLDDGWFMAYQDPEILIKHFKDSSGNTVHPFDSFSYILVIAGS